MVAVLPVVIAGGALVILSVGAAYRTLAELIGDRPSATASKTNTEAMTLGPRGQLRDIRQCMCEAYALK